MLPEKGYESGHRHAALHCRLRPVVLDDRVHVAGGSAGRPREHAPRLAEEPVHLVEVVDR